MGGRNPEQINKYSWNVMSIKQILISKEYNGCAVNRPYIIKNGNKYKMKILL